jgi:WD40 repeat protein
MAHSVRFDVRNSVQTMLFTDEGKLITASQRGLRKWSLEKWKSENITRFFNRKAHFMPVLVKCGDDSWLSSGAKEGFLHLHNHRGGAQIPCEREIQSLTDYTEFSGRRSFILSEPHSFRIYEEEGKNFQSTQVFEPPLKGRISAVVPRAKESFLLLAEGDVAQLDKGKCTLVEMDKISTIFNRGGGSLAMGHEDGSLSLVDPCPSSTDRACRKHSCAVKALTSIPPYYLATGDERGQIYLWDARWIQRPIGGWRAQLPVPIVSLAGIENTLAAANGNGQLSFWDLRTMR